MRIMPTKESAKEFYDREYLGKSYAGVLSAKEHLGYVELQSFIDKFGLQGKRCLEIGCGRGAFQDLVEDYTGVDISDSVRTYLHKPFFQGTADKLPFGANEFDAIWSLWVLEHVAECEKAVLEMRRVLKPNGLLYLYPAWYTRPWFANGYPVRAYSDFDWRGKLVKASIVLRDFFVLRAIHIFTRRILSCVSFWLNRRPIALKYRRLKGNNERYWMSDSDAVNSFDPTEMILFLCSRGDKCLSHRGPLSVFFARGGPCIFQVNK